MKNVAFAIACLGIAVLSGCGGGGPVRYTLTGQLTKGGAPLSVSANTLVNLIFVPQQEGSQSTYPATFNRNEGTYEIKVAPGKYKVNLLISDFQQQPPTILSRPAINNMVYDVDGDKVINIDIPK